MKKRIAFLLLLAASIPMTEAAHAHGWHSGRWHEKYADVLAVPSLFFTYRHGVLAGSYPEGESTTEVRFSDVCAYLGHVCLCGAGGYKIAAEAVREMGGLEKLPERGEFILISGRDHAVGDVIAYVLGCARRSDPEKSTYFIRSVDGLPRREYRYVIAYPPTRSALRVVYRKHLLVGNEAMDGLWEIELGYDEDPGSVGETDVDLYRDMMETMVRDVLFDRKEGLIETRMIPYDEFTALLDSLRG
ncbi:MAG: hypothetical protein JW958_04360 [Candidatus Eisenbacteria bacterium]|nr:hypothetical protein [Candidatus Eisenbacteria bacterium]